ncbi:DMT family transporter [Methylocystis parvus]|uniref:DMT family transporter n=1 Tax=Methylocystis parvus TaxID=134 RepID=UPI003C770297
MNRLRADLLLLAVSVIWGTAFIAQKHGNAAMGPISFVGARFLVSWAALLPLALFESKRARSALKIEDIGLAGLIGLCLFSGSTLQQIGLVATTATNAGFLTALYVILLPFIVWMITGARPRPMVLIASVISIAGAWLLTEQGRFEGWNSGDGLVLISDIAWATGISLVPIFLKRANRPFFLAFAQYGVAATLGVLGGLGFESFSLEGVATALPAILYAGLLSGGVAFTLQIVAQKYTPPAEAGLIMSLESVFAALAGAALLSERLSGPAIMGCVLILLGVALAEVGPAMRNIKLRTAKRAPTAPSANAPWQGGASRIGFLRKDFEPPTEARNN